MISIPYFNNKLDQHFIDILNFYIVGEVHCESTLNKFKQKIEILFMDHCVEDFLGYFHQNRSLFFGEHNENTDEDMIEIRTFYFTDLGLEGERYIGEFFLKEIQDEDGADKINAFITLYKVQNNISFTIASSLSYIASMYANIKPELDVPMRQRRFRNYVSMFKNMSDSNFHEVFNLLEFDLNVEV